MGLGPGGSLVTSERSPPSCRKGRLGLRVLKQSALPDTPEGERIGNSFLYPLWLPLKPSTQNGTWTHGLLTEITHMVSGLHEIPWPARRSNRSILREISPGCSMEGLMLKLKLQYFGHLMWKTDSLKRNIKASFVILYMVIFCKCFTRAKKKCIIC